MAQKRVSNKGIGAAGPPIGKGLKSRRGLIHPDPCVDARCIVHVIYRATA